MLPPRLPFSSAEGGASRAARLCARSGDRRRDDDDDDDNRVELLLRSLILPRDYIVVDEPPPAAWCTRTKGRTRDVDREDREKVNGRRIARNSRSYSR